MTLWSALKFEILEGEKSVEDPSDSASLSEVLPGIKRLTKMPKNNNIGYSVENKPIGYEGKRFTGVVLVPQSSTPNDCFKALTNVFGSQNDIVGIPKAEAIGPFKNRIEKERKDFDYLLDECKKRLLDGKTIQWWKLDEVEKLAKAINEGTLTEKVEKVEKVELAAKNVPKDEQAKDPKSQVDGKLKQKEGPTGTTPDKQEDKAAKYKRKLIQKEEQVKTMEEEIMKQHKEIGEKDGKIKDLSNDLGQLETDIAAETENAKKVMEEKEHQISELEKEIGELENKVKKLEISVKVLTDEKMDWSNEPENETVNEYEKQLQRNKESLEVALLEKNEIQRKLNEAEEKLKEKAEEMHETGKQLAIISDNSKYLQAELVSQKATMENNLNQVQKQLEKQTKETSKLREEIENKEIEIQVLKKQVEAQKQPLSPSGKELSTDEKIDAIWKSFQEQAKPKEAAKPTENYHESKSNYINSDVQVQRVKSKGVKFIMTGHPELLRNMENIPSVKKGILELIRTGNIEVITQDVEGFHIKSLVEDKISPVLKKAAFSAVTKEKNTNKDIDKIIIFPGNHYVGCEYIENTKGKSEYMRGTKLRSSVGPLVEGIVDILNLAAGKEVIIVIDPASEETYEFSMHFLHTLQKDVDDWKKSLDGGATPKITVLNLLEEQKNVGVYSSDKRNTFEIEEKDGPVWLDRSFVTADSKRVSKKATIRMYNRVIDLTSDSRPPAEACKSCGIQQSSAYVAKCVEGDKGEYRCCEVCWKDQHDKSICWSLKYKSDKVCKHRKCLKKELQHSVHVHDIMNKMYRDEAVRTLGYEVEFWPKPRIRRPFMSRDGFEGPLAKQKKSK